MLKELKLLENTNSSLGEIKIIIHNYTVSKSFKEQGH